MILFAPIILFLVSGFCAFPPPHLLFGLFWPPSPPTDSHMGPVWLRTTGQFLTNQIGQVPFLLSINRILAILFCCSQSHAHSWRARVQVFCRWWQSSELGFPLFLSFPPTRLSTASQCWFDNDKWLSMEPFQLLQWHLSESPLKTLNSQIFRVWLTGRQTLLHKSQPF